MKPTDALHIPATEPRREGLTTAQRWHGPDSGLIACWERGRDKALEDPSLARRARSGELPVLPWRGGGDKALKTAARYGTYQYLAMWLGLRGEDLHIDPTHETTRTCTRHGTTVTFTSDINKFCPVSADKDEMPISVADTRSS